MPIKENVRRKIIVILIGLIAVAAGTALRNFSLPLQTEQDVPVYKYTQQAQVDYQVHLRPNSFFDEKTAGPGRAYITSLTDYIETRLSYRISGDAPASIQGDMEVIGVLTGYIIQEKAGSQAGEKEKVIVWQKTTPLISSTPYATDKGTAEINKVIPIDLSQFKAFADQVNTEFRNPTENVDLTVIYNITANVDNQSGTTSAGKVTPQMVIPLKGNIFVVGGALSDKKDQTINLKQVVEVPGVKASRFGATGAVVFLILLLLGILGGSIPEKEDPLDRTLRQIMKKHGNRIATAQGLIPRGFENHQIFLESLEDLIKVADELSEPILYESHKTDLHSFYVVREPWVYTYDLGIEAFPAEVGISSGAESM
ncbi:MAG: DUF5305 family protein [Syntrophomonadaceae bacterium]|nr:DUF5305 family protein [Syntrophomonadaceae bacterium]